jgi:hypothetical protein
LANGQFLSRCVLANLKKLDIYRGICGLSTLFLVNQSRSVRTGGSCSPIADAVQSQSYDG